MKESAAERRAGVQRASKLLRLCGALLLLAAAFGVAYGNLARWLLAQDRYLLAQSTAVLSVPVPDAAHAPSTAVPSMPGATQAPGPAMLSIPDATQVPSVPGPAGADPSPTGTPPQSPADLVPVQIRIPALKVLRSIVEAPRVRNQKTGSWTWDLDHLLPRGRQDLVGHLEGSANPGQAGNTILAGHNYGYGVKAVFLRLGRLKAGQKIYVVNRAGETFTYRVVEVKRLRWNTKKAEQWAAHRKYLGFEGPERLTLITCGGANFAPFPDRIYVVAERQDASGGSTPVGHP